MEEDLEILEKELANIRNLIDYYTFENLDYNNKFRMERFKKAIENLIARNKELEGCNDRLFRIIEDSILKSKVRELQDKYKSKIEKLESKKIWNEPVDTINKNRYTNYYNAYEELLQEGDK